MAQKPPSISGNRPQRKRRFPSLGTSATLNEAPETFHRRKQREQAATDAAEAASTQTHNEQAFQSEVTTRLRRIETRLVSGLETLGATVVNHRDGITVGSADEFGVGMITITSLGTTVKDILGTLGTRTGTYDIAYNNKVKCQIIVGEVL